MTREEISAALHRAATCGPTPDQVHVDDAGTGWARYVIEYTDDNGRQFTMHLWAQDSADAVQRLDAVRRSGRVLGQVYLERDVA